MAEYYLVLRSPRDSIDNHISVLRGYEIDPNIGRYGGFELRSVPEAVRNRHPDMTLGDYADYLASLRYKWSCVQLEDDKPEPQDDPGEAAYDASDLAGLDEDDVQGGDEDEEAFDPLEDREALKLMAEEIRDTNPDAPDIHLNSSKKKLREYVEEHGYAD